mgnify:CR=1 FL=1
MSVGRVPYEMSHAAPSTVAEFRLKVQQAEQERAAMRAGELAAQTSPAKGAEERIRIWERLHELRLPRSSGHALVRVIAMQTHLSVGQVHEEQRRRAAGSVRPEAEPVQPEAVPVLP